MSAMEMLLGEGTKGKILENLLEGAKTTKALSKSLGVRESAIRMHLERMVEMGVLTSSFYREGVGRPKKRFSLTSAGHELFTKKYDLILESMLAVLLEKEGDAYVRSLFTTVGRRLADSLGGDVLWASREKTPEVKAQALVKVMNNMGQRAELVRSDGALQIVNHNCVFRSTAIKYPGLFCDLFHKTFVEKLLSPTKVDFRESLAKGGKECVFTVRAPH